MTGYFSTFANVTVPIVLACAIGFVYQRVRSPDSKQLADISLFILSPCLIVSALATSELNGSVFGSIALFTLVQTAFCWAASAAVGRLFKFDISSRKALEMTTIFANSNNYGLPLLLLAFGTGGFAIGVTNVITHIVLINTLGLYLASSASFRPLEALKKVGQTPLVYAAIAGVGIFLFRVELPEPLTSGLELLGTAYPAVVLLLLGVQLGKTNWRSNWRKELWVSLAMRLVAVPALSWLTIHLLGIHGLEASVLFVQSSMPAAINSLVMMEKYGGDKELVAVNVAFTTLASFLYLPLLIHWSGGL
ncbi:AEC family transporter [Cohnella lubricantis]|uniref:AEC family transporter n=1 Tax=Cohnella lubricantis TaxID=2163172 RepID=A0A841T5S8_9BACL|nr:AEC family transporter [Cohnella lubricantis]MBB6676674.1 AEC family transporter [Cohnella lubricantis]MBP2120605.1 putative permease [Cohnella lubricantis]